MPSAFQSAIHERPPRSRINTNRPAACYPSRMPSHSTAPAGMSPAVVILMLTLLLGIQPVTTDLYLPALPTLQHDLGASLAAAQMTS